MKLRLSQIATLALAASVYVNASQSSQTPTPSQTTNPASNGKMTVQLFFQKLAEANQTEIGMSQLAGARASSSELMDYARMVKENHAKVLSSLQELASRKSINLKSSSSTNYEPGSESSGGAKPQATHMGDLTAKSGAEFDRAYIRRMVESHQKAVALFEQQKQAKLGDADVLGFIDAELPTLRNHLSKALDIEKRLIASNLAPGSH